MNCPRARKLMTRVSARSRSADPDLARHLDSCPECARFAERLAAVRQSLRNRRTPVIPDAGFAARVTARLDPPADPFAWAARRLLPVTLALTLVLGGWCVLQTPSPASLAAELADGDLLTWVASGGEETP